MPLNMPTSKVGMWQFDVTSTKFIDKTLNVVILTHIGYFTSDFTEGSQGDNWLRQNGYIPILFLVCVF